MHAAICSIIVGNQSLDFCSKSDFNVELCFIKVIRNQFQYNHVVRIATVRGFKMMSAERENVVHQRRQPYEQMKSTPASPSIIIE